MTNPKIQRLAEYFEKLPGIGPKQARRFVYALLNKDKQFINSFSKSITEIKNEIIKCPDCQRFIENKCNICNDLNRGRKKLLVVEKDVDLDNIEKAGFYDGMYYVLGGLVPALGAELPKEVKMKGLFEKVKQGAKNNGLNEIILAFSATSDADNTIRYIEKILEPIGKKVPIKISRLGRGLSTGTELEYSDSETIINALKNRQ